LDNHIYDLIKAILKRSQSVWKYDKYLEDSNGCAECKELWNHLKEVDEQALGVLKKVLESHAGRGMLR
jgi:hypothetical protein